MRASGSGVEYNLAKVGVAGSNPVSRFFFLLRRKLNRKNITGADRIGAFLKIVRSFRRWKI